MKTILICNTKGGVGKSLICDELAFAFERAAIPFSFYDLDNQGGTLHQTKKDKKARITLIDTPGALQGQVVEWMKGADLIIVPTRTTSRDIEPLQRMREIINANTKAPVLYVLNCWTRWTASKSFLAWLTEQIGEDAPVITIPQSEQFVQAGAYRESVVSYAPKSPAAQAIDSLYQMVLELIALKH